MPDPKCDIWHVSSNTSDDEEKTGFAGLYSTDREQLRRKYTRPWKFRAALNTSSSFQRRSQKLCSWGEDGLHLDFVHMILQAVKNLYNKHISIKTLLVADEFINPARGQEQANKIFIKKFDRTFRKL